MVTQKETKEKTDKPSEVEDTPPEIEKAEKPDGKAESKIVAGKNMAISKLKAKIVELEEKAEQDKSAYNKMEARLRKAGTVALGILQTRWHNWQPFEAPVVAGKTGIHLKDEDGGELYETITVNYDDPKIPVYVVGLQTRTVDGKDQNASGLILIYIDDNDRHVYLNFVEGWTVTNNRKAAHLARKKGNTYSIKPLK